MRLIKVLGLAFSLGACASLQGAEPKKAVKRYSAEKDKIVRVTGTVDESTMSAAAQLDAVSQKNPGSNITILVNSPGGSVLFLEFFVDAMNQAKARGNTLTCVIPNLAASAAFTITATCDQKIALKSARFLFHPARIGYMGYLTGKQAAEIAAGLAPTDQALLDTLAESFFGEVDRESDKYKLMVEHFFAETLFNTAQLNEFIGHEYIQIVDLIDGIPDLYKLD